jgi:hypothetical protein
VTYAWTTDPPTTDTPALAAPTTAVGTGTLPPVAGTQPAGLETQPTGTEPMWGWLSIGLILGIGIGRLMIRVKIVTTATRRAFRL